MTGIDFANGLENYIDISERTHDCWVDSLVEHLMEADLFSCVIEPLSYCKMNIFIGT